MINILSLFDGMSCGQIALDQLGIKVDNYYASEIDKYAIEIAKKNYPNTIHLGDVTQVKGSDLPQIDLLIGGSPCQGFSFSGKQLNFDDPRSVLFFEYVRLLKECQPKYFLLENVKMKKEFEDIISEHLGVKPIIINSALVSAQNRQRLYWTNISVNSLPEDKHIFLKDIFEEEADELIYKAPYYKRYDKEDGCIGYVGKQPKQATRVYSTNGKSQCLTALGGGQGGKTGLYEIPMAGAIRGRQNNQCRKLTPTECERLQNVPVGYTEGVSNAQRYKMLGNGWTVEVIKHILKNIGS